MRPFTIDHFHCPAIAGAGLKDASLVAFEHERCKHTGAESTSIYAYAIAAVRAPYGRQIFDRCALCVRLRSEKSIFRRLAKKVDVQVPTHR